MASCAVVDLTSVESEPELPVQVVHLIHPKSQPARVLFELFSEELGLPVTSYECWMKLLLEQRGTADMKKIPALKILTFFVEDFADSVYGRLTMECKEAKRLCPSLREVNVKELARADVQMWLNHWRSVGFLPDTRRVSRL